MVPAPLVSIGLMASLTAFPSGYLIGIVMAPFGRPDAISGGVGFSSQWMNVLTNGCRRGRAQPAVDYSSGSGHERPRAGGWLAVC